MKRDELELGKIYVVAGRGEMKLVEFCPPPASVIRQFRAYGGLGVPDGLTVRLEAHGGWSHFASHDELVREATQADLDAREAQARPRGVECKDPECWCKNTGATH